MVIRMIQKYFNRRYFNDANVQDTSYAAMSLDHSVVECQCIGTP